MPIIKLRETDFEQQCIVCGGTRAVLLRDLQAGVTIAAGVADPDVIALPPCLKCGACEFLIRSPAGPTTTAAVAGTRDDRAQSHRLLVDQLHARLTREGRTSVVVANASGDGRATAPASEVLGTT